MMLLLRLLPYFTPLVVAVTGWLGWRYPAFFPWMFVLGFAVVFLAASAIAWRRVRMADFLEKMAPTFLLMAALAFSSILVEGTLAHIAWLVIAALGSGLSLELLFLYAYDPLRYPVNGLSHVNIGYIPIIAWYAASTSSGLIMFLHTDRVWHVVLMVVLSVMMFRTTGHPGATREQNAVWSLFGGLVGLHVGLLGIVLPLSLSMQGVVAAVIISASLRVRRYMYDPKPSFRQGWMELSFASVALLSVLSTAKWL